MPILTPLRNIEVAREYGNHIQTEFNNHAANMKMPLRSFKMARKYVKSKLQTGSPVNLLRTSAGITQYLKPPRCQIASRFQWI